MQRTQIKDKETKIDIIDHLNLDHKKELLAIAQLYIAKDITNVNIVDLFEQGILLQTDKGAEHFVQFLIEGDLHHKIRQLAMTAVKKLGKNNDELHWLFRVENIQFITPNLCRLTLKTQDEILSTTAGYAWRFSLTSFSSQLSKQQICEQARPLPSRYYTLRKFISKTEQGESLVLVDIFLHNDSAGSSWAKQLKIGEIIHAYHEYYEHTEHLAQGQTVLIADETGFPTLAAILENWHNPIAPTVVSISHQPEEQDYFTNDKLPCNFTIFKLNQQNVSQQIIQILATLPQIDNVWGAFESQQAKAVRIYLRNQRGLKAEQNRVKGYWRATVE